MFKDWVTTNRLVKAQKPNLIPVNLRPLIGQHTKPLPNINQLNTLTMNIHARVTIVNHAVHFASCRRVWGIN